MDQLGGHRREGATGAGAAAALGLAGAGTAGAAAALLAAGTAEQLAATGARAPLGEAVPVLATGAGAVVTGWLAVVLLLGAVAALPRRPGPAGALPALARRCAPRLAPRVAAVLTGAVVAAAGTASAQAVPSPTAVAPGAPCPTASVPTASAIPVPWLDQPAEHASSRAGDGPASVPRPDLTRRPGGASPATADVAPAGERAGQRPPTIEVVAGDTLWELAAAHLPAGATDADVARAWPRWHAANREVIGPDPDLLLPGQRLRLPEGAAGHVGADR